jgi:glycosyltransferase involved in cell wall biosynthesis
LGRLAAREPADLFIGHYPAGLAAAAAAAARWNAKLGYDIEDLHAGECPPTPAGRRRANRIDAIERIYVSRCLHITASSPGIAEYFARRYGVSTPHVIYNTFPWADRTRIDGETRDRRGPALSLYWYSQTVGLDRGLQDAIQAIGLLGGAVQLHIRGSLSETVSGELLQLARDHGVADRVYFHPQVPPDELMSRAAEHDIGLALEQGQTPNRAIATTNKLFFYLLAGLAVAATDVPGQTGVLRGCGGAARLHPPGDVRTLAQHLEHWRLDPLALRASQDDAIRHARLRWNWECEGRKLVDAIADTIALPHPLAQFSAVSPS